MHQESPASAPSRSPHESHDVQFYEDEDFLCETVASFLGAGLLAGEPVVVIATEAHREAFCERLRARSIDVARACMSGQLRLLDARETLAQFMVGDEPSPERFRAVLGGVLDDVLRGRSADRVSAYGEMVDLLWRDGNEAAAVRLEELWNDLGRDY